MLSSQARQFSVLTMTLVLLSAAGCAGRAESAREPTPSDTSRASLNPPTLADTTPRDFPGLHNVVAYKEQGRLLSGSQPEGDIAFDSLRDLGVKTIISVDGAEPEVDKAAARGIRYIHLPIGYNGFDESRRLELVRATRDAEREGPVYLHCHHGKHRSAGAAAAVAAGLGWMTAEQGVARMKVSGTAANYTGLYSCAANSSVLAISVIDAVPAEFPSVAKPSGFVQGMIDVDHAFEHLKQIEASGWTTPADHPDLVPVAEAGRLADLMRVLAQGDRARSKPADFAELMHENSRRAQALEDALASPAPDKVALSAQFKLVAASCKDCHAKYRD